MTNFSQELEQFMNQLLVIIKNSSSSIDSKEELESFIDLTLQMILRNDSYSTIDLLFAQILKSYNTTKKTLTIDQDLFIKSINHYESINEEKANTSEYISYYNWNKEYIQNLRELFVIS